MKSNQRRPGSANNSIFNWKVTKEKTGSANKVNGNCEVDQQTITEGVSRRQCILFFCFFLFVRFVCLCCFLWLSWRLFCLLIDKPIPDKHHFRNNIWNLSWQIYLWFFNLVNTINFSLVMFCLYQLRHCVQKFCWTKIALSWTGDI